MDDPDATVVVTINGKEYPATNNGDGTWSIPDNTIDPLSDGENSITVTAKDPAGNEGQGEGVVTVDATAPTITVEAPDLTNDNTPTITGTTNAANGTTISLVVTDANGSTQTFTTTANNGSYSVDVPNALPDGGYSVTASVTDAAGNSASATDDNGIVNETPTAENSNLSIDEDSVVTLTMDNFHTSSSDITAVKVISVGEGNIKVNGVEVANGDEITKEDLDSGNVTYTPKVNSDETTDITFQLTYGYSYSSTAVTTVDINAIADVVTLSSSISNPHVVSVDSSGEMIDMQLDSVQVGSNHFGVEVQSTSVGSSSADQLVGNSENNFIDGKAGADALHGNDGDDIFVGREGNDAIYGGNGSDVAVFSGSKDDYMIEFRNDHNSNGYLNVIDTRLQDSNPQNVATSDAGDHLYGIEKLVFADGIYSLNPTNGDLTLIEAFDMKYEYTLDISAALGDSDGSETLSIQITGLPDGAILSDGVKNSDGSWTITPNDTSYDGSVKVILPLNSSDFDLNVMAVARETSNSDTATASNTHSVSVPAYNSSSVSAGDDDFIVEMNGELTINVATDILVNDSAGVTISSYSKPDHGEIIDNGDGSVTYKPDSGFYGEDKVVYTITDANGNTSGASVTFNVNDVPLANDVTFDTVVDPQNSTQSSTFTLADYATDILDDADSSKVTQVRIDSLPTDGTLIAVVNGMEQAVQVGDVYSDDTTFTYTANSNINTTVNLGTHNGENVTLSDWGSYTSDGLSITGNGVTISGYSNGTQVGVGFTNDDNNSHDGVGIGVIGSSDDGQIEAGPNEKLLLEFDKPMENMEFGLSGLGGHFDASGVDAKAHYVAYKDGVVVAEGDLQQDISNSDGDNNIYTNVFSVDVEFDTIELTTNSSQNSNYSLEYIKGDIVGEDSFTYSTIDSDGLVSKEAGTVSFDIQTQNEVPTAVNETQQLSIEDINPVGNTINVVITLDISGSMDDDGKLDYTKEALVDMLNTYGDGGNVNVKLVTFSEDASNHGWMSKEDAIDYINNLQADGSTNYEDALLKTYDNYSEPAADTTIAYLISDGEPTTENNDYPYGESGLVDSKYVNGWNEFVDANVDSLHVVGIGSGADTDYLENIAQAGNVEPTIVTDKVGFMDAVIIEDSDSISGNILDNVTGGDGDIAIASIKVGDTIYLASNYETENLTLTTPKGATLELDFTTGDYTYTISSTEISEDTIESFEVFASDEDGDITTFDVTFNTDVTMQQADTPTITMSVEATPSGSYEYTQTVNDELREHYGDKDQTYSVGGYTHNVTIDFNDFDDGAPIFGSGLGGDKAKVELLDGNDVVATYYYREDDLASGDIAVINSNIAFNNVKITADQDNFTVHSITTQGNVYALSITATLSDANETLSDVIIDKSSLPDGATLSGNGIEDRGDYYSIDVSSGVEKSVEIHSVSELSSDDLSAIEASVSSSVNGFSAEASTTASVESTTIPAPSLASDSQDNEMVYDGNEVDGGLGLDTLLLNDGMNLNFDNISDIKNIEVIDLTQGEHAVDNLTFEDVLSMTDESNELTILGDNQDSVTLKNSTSQWQQQGVVSENGHTFDVYTNEGVTVKIEQDINDTIVS